MVVLFAAFAVSSCTHEPKVVAGKGGSAIVTVYPQHHENAKRLVNVTVLVKYNTSDAPAGGLYDDSVSGSNHDSLVSAVFAGLQNGNYYFYARATDTSVHQVVKGGAPYTITSQSAQSMVLPVSE